MIDEETALAHQQAVGALEEAAKKRSSAALKDHLAEVGRNASADWVRMFGDLDQPSDDPAKLLRLIVDLRAGIKATPTSDLREAAEKALVDAIELGRVQAIEVIGHQVKTPELKAPKQLVKDAVRLEAKVQKKLDDGVDILDKIAMSGEASFDDVVGGLSKASDGINTVDNTVSWLTNSGQSAGVNAVTKVEGIGRVWVTERDGCVDCLAYAGQVTDGDFPGGLTFGDFNPVSDLPDPPLHVNCRCTTEPWDMSAELDPDEVSYPEALQREAERSVLKGWSVASESEAVRLKAADKLLKAGTDMPKSVQKAAERAVKKGEFASTVPPV